MWLGLIVPLALGLSLIRSSILTPSSGPLSHPFFPLPLELSLAQLFGAGVAVILMDEVLQASPWASPSPTYVTLPLDLSLTHF